MKFEIGQMVRIVRRSDGMAKRYVGRLVTVRAFSDHSGVRVDDGNPADADIHTNGFRISAWVPASTLEEL